MSMERERRLFDAITGIRDDLIEKANTKAKAKRPKWQAWGAIAACAVLVVGIGGVMLWQNILPFGGSSGDAGSSGNGHGEGSTVFMSYAGPVFPLTLSEQDSQVTADRHITYDFSLANEDSLRVWGAGVLDNYILTNHSDEDLRVNILYPYAGSFSELEKQQPTIRVDGTIVQPNLYPGGYSGEFTGVYGADDPDGSENLKRLDSWEGYKNLLADGSYQENAFSSYPKLNQRVIVWLDYKGELFVTYPSYEDGWNVTAYPDGTIINKTDSAEYSYLFWEGNSDYEYDFSTGFVVAGKDTEAFLREKLKFMGLIPKEYNEFIVYWLPIMINNPYNLISFQQEAYTDNAVLEITPAPDSILRVFMAFKPLTEAIEIEEQKLEPFHREGFAVVEWGGSELAPDADTPD